MLANPKSGQTIILRYRDHSHPLHLTTGRVVIVGRGKPRNHGVMVGGGMFVVPCGQIFKMEKDTV
jgi:hypothetical protein